MYINTFYQISRNLAAYIKKYDLKSMVLGLSGGIDSTLCALICNQALSEFDESDDIHLYLLSLPSNTNGNDENDIAVELGNGLLEMDSRNRISFQLWSIENEFNTMLGSMQHYAGEIGALQRGNIKARIRMMHLYNLASMHRGIVIDTDNLTEHNLGFWTIHGDVGDVNPIGRLWKTEIYELSRLCLESLDLSDRLRKALSASIDITPTDGNGVKVGGDLAQIAPGLTYNEVDEVLRNELLPIDDRKREENRAALCGKYTNHLVRGIIDRHRKSEYKRHKMPFVLETF